MQRLTEACLRNVRRPASLAELDLTTPEKVRYEQELQTMLHVFDAVRADAGLPPGDAVRLRPVRQGGPGVPVMDMRTAGIVILPIRPATRSAAQLRAQP